MNFAEAKRKKERGMSNQEFLTKYQEELINSETMVIVCLDENKFINTYQTSDSQLNTIGMLEIAKKQILEDMEAY